MTKRVFALLTVFIVSSISMAEWISANGATGAPKITILEQNSSRTVFEVTVPGVEINRTVIDNEEFALINLPNEVMAVLDEGKPQVPKVSVLLAIPERARLRFQVLDKESQVFKVGRVYPLQPPLLDGEEPGPFVIDNNFYNQNVSYPEMDVALIHTGKWRDLSVANLQVYPVKVNPAKGEIEVIKRIRVRVDYEGGFYPQLISDWMVPFYSHYIDNFHHLPVQTPTTYSAGVRYLVFCHQNYDTCTYLNDSLLAWVHQRGYEVRKITKSSFTASEIKDSIRAEYNRNDPHLLRWVLLVGEYGEIPMGSYSGVGYSDFWYCDLEPWPGGDNYPEIGIARISPASITDLNNQISKIMKYQKNPPTTNSWLDKLTMPAHSEQYPGKYSGCVRGIYNMPKPYWNPSVVETIMGYYTGNTTVTNALNQGRGIVAYRGHGDYFEWWEWGTEGSWYNSHIYALNNGDMTPVVYNIACNNGRIYDSTCLSEAWMRKYPGGAVASLGATQASYTYPNHGICSTLVRATCDTWTITVPGVRNYGPTPYNLADIKCYGVDAYVAKYWPSSPYPYNIWMYVMLGDPAMPVWAGGMPQTPTVTLPDSIPTGPYNLNVTVKVGTRPVEGALVCAWKESDVYVAERTNDSGVATLAVNATTPGYMRITVSEGHCQHSTPGAEHTPILPFSTTRPVAGGGTPQPNVVYVSNQVIDSPPGGNNNGRFEPGESGKIIVVLKNTGNLEAQNVTAQLKSSNSLFVITDSTANYGDIPPDSVRNNRSDPFLAQADARIPPGTFVTCTLKVHSENFQHDWTYTFNLRIGEPPQPPGTIIWGPKVCPGMPSDWGLYGVAYNRQDSLIYCVYFMSPTVYKYTSDSLLQSRGTITLPEDSCTDIAYCSYDNTFWLVANPSKRVYKITPSGSVVRYFTVPEAEYPCGVVEDEENHLVYVSDRRGTTTPQQRIFVYDTLGNILDTINHPVSGVYGTRCLALDERCPENPPSVLNIFTWFDPTGTYLDSCGMLEIDRVNWTLRNRFRFTNTEWNIRGIEYDPRDGSYWVTIMQYSSGSNNMIFKVVGFNMGSVGVEEKEKVLPELSRGIRVAVRPNPFTGRTVLSVALENPGLVDLQVYDNLGRLVRNVARSRSVISGSDFIWDGRDDAGAEVARGVYFYRVRTDKDELWGKMVLTR